MAFILHLIGASLAMVLNSTLRTRMTMTDLLSIASGIAGWLSLGIQVTQSLIDFYAAYEKQDIDLAKIFYYRDCPFLSVTIYTPSRSF